MIKIAICDDSLRDATSLENLCKSCNLKYDIKIHTFTDTKLFLTAHQKNLYDIVFLDIEMPNHSGIELGKQLRKMNEKTIIIFSTSYPQYAIEGYDCEAFQYLLKPISQEKLEDTLNRAANKISVSRQYHSIKIHNIVRRIPISEIYFIEYCRKHVIYHMKNEQIETTGRFSDVIQDLQEYGFYQIHQGYIVNFDKIKDIREYSVILEDNRTVMISVRKKKEVVLAYTKYVESNL